METEAQRQEIFDTVCTMESFTRHMRHPKLQIWFAWNGVCHEQKDEFWGTKLIFEALEYGETDEGERFSIKAGTDVRAELQRILKSGGGLGLGFHLVHEG